MKKNIDGKCCIGQDFQNCAKDIPTLWQDNSSRKKKDQVFFTGGREADQTPSCGHRIITTSPGRFID